MILNKKITPIDTFETIQFMVFGIITILTMIAVVLLLSFGFKSIRLGKVEKYTHAIAGATILLSGCAIVFLGL